MKIVYFTFLFTVFTICQIFSQTKVNSISNSLTPQDTLTSEQDHLRILKLLGIDSLRPGPSGDPKDPNAANADESIANPYPNLPDPLKLNNGKKVSTPEMWWKQRRPEIKEFFDREIYGRMPVNVPKVNWEVVSVTKDTVKNIPVITKKLLGHVNNISYPLISVNIDLTLITPANAKGPVPVMMEFGFNFPANFNMTRPDEKIY